MLLSGKAVQLQAGAEAQAAQLSMTPRQKGRTRADLFHSGVPGNCLAHFPMHGLLFLMFHLDNALRHITEFLGVSCAGPGVEHDYPCESLPTHDIDIP